ncbi:hypothetical protein PINS_up007917 [Pythium insidiosum]|nr:hypothetical protein PINS_up007917 [Pythium insidiosum]
MRWTYWRQIEVSEDCYKLKILGYYHRKIAKFVGSFPATMASSDIQRYYRTRGILQVSLFSAAYITCLALLLRSSDAEVLWIWILYLLTIGSGLVVFRFLKMHFVELPQVLILRDHPEVRSPTLDPRPSLTLDASAAVCRGDDGHRRDHSVRVAQSPAYNAALECCERTRRGGIDREIGAVIHVYPFLSHVCNQRNHACV